MRRNRRLFSQKVAKAAEDGGKYGLLSPVLQQSLCSRVNRDLLALHVFAAKFTHKSSKLIVCAKFDKLIHHIAAKDVDFRRRAASANKRPVPDGVFRSI